MYEMRYRHCIAEGTHYEIGFALGNLLDSDNQQIESLVTPLFGGEPLTKNQVEDTAAIFEKYCPGINDEIKGFSDAVNVTYRDMVIYSSYLTFIGGCSHFVACQRSSAQRKIYHARNYDYNFDEYPTLITTRPIGKNFSTGFSCKVFGRFDGMNNKGLCVTTSAADVNHTKDLGNGFIFPIVVRAMLEQCSSVYEAKEMLNEMPYAEYRNFILSDKEGVAVLVECSPENKSLKFIDHEEGYLCSANHFILDQCSIIKPVKHSCVRQALMERVLSQKDGISFEGIKTLLSEQYPMGLTLPYYNSGMGTLWSIIYDSSTMSQYVCFGSPNKGAWHLVNSNDKPGCTEMIVSLEDIDAPDDLWE